MESNAPVTNEPVPTGPAAPIRYEDVDPYIADHRDQLLMQTRWNLMTASQMSDL